MKACIILHNMIIEEEKDENEAAEFDYKKIEENPPIQVSQEQRHEFMAFTKSHQHIQDHEIHSQLQSNLVDYLWQLQGGL